MFSITPHLVTVELELDFIHSHTHPMRSIKLPRLISFSLFASREPSRILNALELPALRDLSIQQLSEPWSMGIGPTLSFLLLHSPLVKLSFIGCVPTDEDMIQILTATPELAELTLQGRCIRCMTNVLLARLIHSLDAPMLIPKLRSIKLHYRLIDSHFNIGAFAAAVESRILAHPSVLEQVIIGFDLENEAAVSIEVGSGEVNRLY